MGVLREGSWCFCSGGGRSERVKASIFSGKGPAMAWLPGGGTGFLIHRGLLLTTHVSLPSVAAAEAAEIQIHQGRVSARLVPHRSVRSPPLSVWRIGSSRPDSGGSHRITGDLMRDSRRCGRTWFNQADRTRCASIRPNTGASGSIRPTPLRVSGDALRMGLYSPDSQRSRSGASPPRFQMAPKRGSDDIGWQHGIMLENRHNFKCNYCGFTGQGGGVSRLKKHLAGG
ncbi:hypothetical protein Taro_017222 [Colocasia esculenta]|uniref:BED-type domain-containing protein n=1 Tax=Colocasia esculenta TaxID=4460 RepID=A0A843UFQ7_COLES|nr:hypothetical protein [Colocasia esculenta]